MWLLAKKILNYKCALYYSRILLDSTVVICTIASVLFFISLFALFSGILHQFHFPILLLLFYFSCHLFNLQEHFVDLLVFLLHRLLHMFYECNSFSSL